MSHRRALGLNLALSFFGLALSLVVAEVFCRLFLPEVRDTNIVPLKEIDCKYHHCPNWLGKLTPPRADAYRIMFLGDSFTYGETRREDAFPQLVETYFRDGSRGAPLNVQTFNLGWPSYSPTIEGVLLRDYQPVLNPNLVVIAVDDGDLQDDLTYSNSLVVDDDKLPLSVFPDVMPGHPDRIPSWLYNSIKRSKLIRLTWRYWYDNFRSHSTASRRPQEFDSFTPLSKRYEHYKPGMEEAWLSVYNRTFDILRAMIRYCRAREVRVLLVNYPYPPAVDTECCSNWKASFGFDPKTVYEPVFHERLRAFAEAQGVDYYDFTPYLRSLPARDGLYNEGAHFTSKGNAYFAGELVRIITPMVMQSSSGQRR